jgi:serine phosphatase RsbU (regulator of sigma subunit)
MPPHVGAARSILGVERRLAVRDVDGSVLASGRARFGEMGQSGRSPVNLNALLAAVEAAPPVAAVDVLAGELAEAIGAREVSFLIADFSGRSLIRLGHSGGQGRLQGKETAERVPLAGTPHGQALATQAVEVIAEDRGARLFAPVTSRGEAVGVLELGLEDFPAEQTVADVALAAHFLAYVVIANRRYTDLFEWGQRSVPLSLAAEIQHRLLPGAFTCEAGQFTLAAWLQPAGEIGGDTFDFSLDRDALHVSMTDAMGHTMEAALLATVLVGALRNARRRGVELAEQARLASDALAEQAGEDQFVTGLLVRIDLSRATAGIVNAGHPPPLRLRAGQVEQIHLEADRPFGLQRGGGYRVQALELEVGDRLMFVTDGMLERDAERMNITAILTASMNMHAREAVQHLTQAVLEASGGQLRDDATALCLDWHGGPPRDRDASSGADREVRVSRRRGRAFAAAGAHPGRPLLPGTVER